MEKKRKPIPRRGRGWRSGKSPSRVLNESAQKDRKKKKRAGGQGGGGGGVVQDPGKEAGKGEGKSEERLQGSQKLKKIWSKETSGIIGVPAWGGTFLKIRRHGVEKNLTSFGRLTQGGVGCGGRYGVDEMFLYDAKKGGRRKDRN